MYGVRAIILVERPGDDQARMCGNWRGNAGDVIFRTVLGRNVNREEEAQMSKAADIMDQIVAGTGSPPPCIKTLRIPRVKGWEPGHVWADWEIDSPPQLHAVDSGTDQQSLCGQPCHALIKRVFVESLRVEFT